MLEIIEQLPMMARRARELASELVALARITLPQTGRGQRALLLAGRARALASAIHLVDDDDVLTIANELTRLEHAANEIRLEEEAPTVRPPPKESGTFVIEKRVAGTNRLLSNG